VTSALRELHLALAKPLQGWQGRATELGGTMNPTYREARPEEAGEIVRLIAAVAAENQWIRTEVPFDLADRARRMTEIKATQQQSQRRSTTGTSSRAGAHGRVRLRPRRTLRCASKEYERFGALRTRLLCDCNYTVTQSTLTRDPSL
jgi:hypothetical protein